MQTNKILVGLCALASFLLTDRSWADHCLTKKQNTPLDVISAVGLTTIEGATTALASYWTWVFLHEGSHAVGIELAGGDVTHFTFTPERYSDGGWTFASVSWRDPDGNITQKEEGLIDLAPNITAAAAAAGGFGLWASGSLPDNRYARIPFTAFQAGAAVNVGLLGWNNTDPANDVPSAIENLDLNRGEEFLLRAGLLTGTVIAFVPVADGVVHAITGETLFPNGGRERPIRLTVGPRSIGIAGTW